MKRFHDLYPPAFLGQEFAFNLSPFIALEWRNQVTQDQCNKGLWCLQKISLSALPVL